MLKRSLKEIPAPPGPAHGDYEIQVHRVATQPHEPEQWYWHLFYKGEKVNGGVADYKEWARERAVQYKFEHHRDVFLRKRFWDTDDRRWVPRDGI
jgi:hypothetical protein